MMFSLNKIVLVAFTAMLSVTALMYMGVKSDLNTAIENNKQLKVSVQSYKNHATYLTDSLVVADEQNKQLIKERDLLSTLRAQHQQQLIAIKIKLNNSNVQLDALRQSTDETTKHWANGCVPNAVVGMFKYATVRTCSKDDSAN